MSGPAREAARPEPFVLDRRELAGAVADVGVLVPIATALIVKNGLSATAVLLPAALLYIGAGLRYRLPIPVQPLKAFGAIAIAKGLGADEIAGGALLMGATFLLLSRTGLIELGARALPTPLIRGVQLTVGLLFLKVAFELVSDPPASFREQPVDGVELVALGALVLVLALSLRKRPVSLALVVVGAAVAIGRAGGDLSFGPSDISLPSLDGDVLWTALTVLVIPQVPLTFANSCVATADAARRYFGERAARVRPGRLAGTLGAANLVAGAISGMPVCHGAGGLTAHRAFGARTGGAPLVLGTLLLVVALVVGAGLGVLLAAFPLPILAGMLAAAGLLHIGLLADLRGPVGWALALTVGLVGFFTNLAIGLGLGLLLWWVPRAVARPRPSTS